MRIFLCVLALTLFAPIAKAQGFPQIKVFETTECTWLPAADGDKGQWVHFFSANELLKQLYEKKGVKGKLSDAALSHLSNTGLSLSKIELRNSPSVGTFASCTPATAVEKANAWLKKNGDSIDILDFNHSSNTVGLLWKKSETTIGVAITD